MTRERPGRRAWSAEVVASAAVTVALSIAAVAAVADAVVIGMATEPAAAASDVAPGAAAAAARPTVAEPSDYRTEEYRAPVPATLAGAAVIGTPEAERLWRAGGTVFIDALPRPKKPDNLPAGTVWHDKPRPSIPRAAWLANVGYGRLSPDMDGYFRDRLAELTGGDKAKPVVFFCQADCWMSWNAAKRAVSWGYTAVLWYPEGTDGWQAAGLPLVEAQPLP